MALPCLVYGFSAPSAEKPYTNKNQAPHARNRWLQVRRCGTTIGRQSADRRHRNLATADGISIAGGLFQPLWCADRRARCVMGRAGACAAAEQEHLWRGAA